MITYKKTSYSDMHQIDKVTTDWFKRCFFTPSDGFVTSRNCAKYNFVPLHDSLVKPHLKNAIDTRQLEKNHEAGRLMKCP